MDKSGNSETVSDLETLGKVKGFKLVHMNVRSITKKIDQLKTMLHDVKLDVITMSESWLNNSVSSNSLLLNNYVMFRQDRNLSVVSKKRGGGLLTYIASKHAADSEELPDISKSNADIEAQWSIIYSPKCRNVAICNVYRPPTGNVKRAIDYLEESLGSFDLERTDVFILGDLNINYLNNSSPEFRRLQFFAKSNGLVQVIQSTTRNNDKSKSLLDVILTNSIYVDSAGTLDHFISDHQPIYVVKGLPTLAVFVDFRKAFDCVQHPILLQKLASINLHKDVLRWFESYLSGRSQRVLANNVFSKPLEVTQGVPQGSVLGPLFYIIYANDISRTIKHCEAALYADDTVLYLSNPVFEKTVKNVQNDVNALSSWCTKNGIQMNVDKTKVMMFGNPKKIENLPTFGIKVKDTPLKTSSEYKYLGMTLDGQLNYDKHIQKVIANVTPKLKQFRRMRGFLNSKAAILIYKNMIMPMIEYGDIFLSGATAENRKKLQILQNKGLRCALKKDKFKNVSELHKEGKIMRLKYRRAQHVFSHMYDMSQFNRNLRGRGREGVGTRSQNKKLLKIRKPNTEKFKKSLAYRGPKSWNALPENIHHTRTRSQFNSQIRAFLEDKIKRQTESSIIPEDRLDN